MAGTGVAEATANEAATTDIATDAVPARRFEWSRVVAGVGVLAAAVAVTATMVLLLRSDAPAAPKVSIDPAKLLLVQPDNHAANVPLNASVVVQAPEARLWGVTVLDPCLDAERGKETSPLRTHPKIGSGERLLGGGNRQRAPGKGDAAARRRQREGVDWCYRDPVGIQSHDDLKIEQGRYVSERISRGPVRGLSSIYGREQNVELTRVSGVSADDCHAPQTVGVLCVSA